MDDSNSHWPKGHPAAAADRQTASPDEAGARLAAIRHEIDAVDQDLLTLFNQRAALSLEVGRIKADVPGIIFKPLREKEVLDSLATRNPGPLPEDHLRAIWREIFSSSRSLQRPQNVAYLGPEGTFSYFAGVEYLGHVEQTDERHFPSGFFRHLWQGRRRQDQYLGQSCHLPCAAGQAGGAY